MRIEVAPEIEPRFRKALRSAGRREIGGMLFAEQLAPSRFRVMDFSVDLSSGSQTNFRRDPGAHEAALNAFFERTGRDFARFNYLGEWHSHPDRSSVLPSGTDLRQVAWLARELCDEGLPALMVIAGQHGEFSMIIDNTRVVLREQKDAA